MPPNNQPQYIPWRESVNDKTLRRVKNAAAVAGLTEIEEGNLLHHVVNCPQCKKEAKL